ncbi:HPr kinase/phosphorylase [Methylobacterium oryzihabitans]|uniref:Serine kinase n=1 Tax=Methylobacterium oryzihabitans TaxID=2499852 RepID=A0A3S2XJQ1_9HYPH|nr:serine kinase [Methylobacterium oryzihabitans]RVU16421.1 serine kinase [Methylobacterium oryzihabitans]
MTVHATCLVLGEVGILIRGPSGSGKTTLARDLLARGAMLRVLAALVGDDRVILTLRHGRVVARPHPALAGLVEIRGHGPQPVEAALPSAIVGLVVDLAETAARLAGPEEESVRLHGVLLPRMILPRDPARTETVVWRWRRLRAMMTVG